MRYEELLRSPPFSVGADHKREILHRALTLSIDHHRANCPEYDRLCSKRGFHSFSDIEEIPYLPVSLFKKLSLTSTSDHVRTLSSSATSSQTPSRVSLDQTTRMRQSKTLLWLLADALGPTRLPFYVVGHPPEESGAMLSAQEAALRGFLMAASSTTYLTDIEQCGHSGSPSVLLGYTYRVYELALRTKAMVLPHTTLLHFGGWKRLQEQAISRDQFAHLFQERLGMKRCQLLDAYGFTEQLGIIYVDRGDGVKRCPLVSEIVIRDPHTLRPLPDGQVGLIELITPLPHSYPGIALLLDDVGRIVSREPSPDGRHGTAFEVLGRAKAAELRGCGDIERRG